MVEKQLIGVKELAERLNVPVSWIYQHTRLKAIPYMRVGKYVRFDLDEVVNFFKKHGDSSIK